MQTVNRLTAVSLPNATKLDSNAFQNCDVLATVSVPKVAEFGTNVFQNNKALKAIDLPSTVTEITGYMFDGCVALESFTVPASVTTIAANAFKGCTALKTLVLEGDAVKTLSNVSAFTNTPFKTADSGAKIVVKAELLEDYKICQELGGLCGLFPGCGCRIKSCVFPHARSSAACGYNAL